MPVGTLKHTKWYFIISFAAIAIIQWKKLFTDQN